MSSNRVVVIALLIALVIACAACARSSTPHIFDDDGVARPDLEPAWIEVERFAGEATPRQVTIEMTEDVVSRFDAPGRRLLIDRDTFAHRGNELVAHELMHVATSALSDGASSEESFRFIDEGLAKIVGARVHGDVADYERQAQATTKRAFADATVNLAAVQRWSTFFGGPKSGRWWTYDVGASFVFFIVHHYGENSLRALLVDIGRTRDLDASLRAVVGVDASTIEREWRADVLSER